LDSCFWKEATLIVYLEMMFVLSWIRSEQCHARLLGGNDKALTIGPGLNMLHGFIQGRGQSLKVRSGLKDIEVICKSEVKKGHLGEVRGKEIPKGGGKDRALGDARMDDHRLRLRRTKKTRGGTAMKISSKPPHHVRMQGRVKQLLEENVWFTESNAFDMSRETIPVCFSRLKPLATAVTMRKTAVVVNLKGQKPCWEEERGREGGFIKGRRRCSRILTAGERREMGSKRS
jgi:hypothetical protein